MVQETLPEQIFAAVDLGSNSFHMIIARLVGGQLQVVDRLRDRVQLAAGCDADGVLDADACARAHDCLQRFGQRLRGIPAPHVRAVGTQTLRRAKNATAFLAAGQDALGHPIEILGGREEARLIYLGVAHTLAETHGARLVVDIGGASTECILGQQFQSMETESLDMGCVTYSREFFPDGKIKRDSFHQAEISARLELQGIARRYRAVGWESSVGASGTICAVEEILAKNAFCKTGITREGLRRLRDALLEAGRTSALTLNGLSAERAQVLPGGVAILSAVFESFAIETMTASTGALREGLLYDLLGRIRHEDVRDRTIHAMSALAHVDTAHATRVEKTAGLLLAQASAWDLSDDAAQIIAWAARLHEMGLLVSHSGHHKHGAYLVANSDMPGFTREEQHRLAALIRGHRRKLTREVFATLAPAHAAPTLRLCLLLRLAVCLHRDRSPDELPALRLACGDDTLRLSFPPGWLADHPLTRAELENEATLVKAVGMRLQLS